MSSLSSSSKVCFNSACTEFKPERPRRGWRIANGQLVELCDRCAAAYDDGRFCDTFHLNASGWRDCESCGKRIHCGCIVSANAFTLLDPGGIECMKCARKKLLLGANPSWPPPLFIHSSMPERPKDFSVQTWSHLAGSGPLPWRQAPSLFNSSILQSDLHLRVPCEVDLSTGIDRLNASETLSAQPLIKKKKEDFSERLMNGTLKHGMSGVLENGNAVIKCEEKTTPSRNKSQHQSSLKENSSTPKFSLSAPYMSPNETNVPAGVSGTQLRPVPPLLSKQFNGNLHNGVDSSVEDQSRNVRPRVESRGKSQLLSRYWPKFTDQDLQKLSVDSNSVIIPLFEKMLSASDAGRIGRLVLPKKCAEAYFPPISQPEGLPLRVQDSKGKEWIFQFRFWPNNNSRMYVLEGVTPCIQNMQLQAGDIVTFSRLDPEGKLIMGFRKASAAPSSDQDNEKAKTTHGVSPSADVELADPNSWSKVDKSGYIAKEALGTKLISRKRKSSILGSRSRRVMLNQNLELKLTCEEAQGLLRPAPNNVPTVVEIDGFDFEEYEDAPVLGKPTIFATDEVGEKIQWASCEECNQWRKVPASALLPPKWTCAGNSWDPERSFCAAAGEITVEQLEDLLRCSNPVKRRFSTLMKRREHKLDIEETNLPDEEETPHQHNSTEETPLSCSNNTLSKEISLDQHQPLEVNITISRPTRKKLIGGSNDDSNKIKTSTSPFKGQIDLNIQPEREEEQLSPVLDSDDMTNLLEKEKLSNGVNVGVVHQDTDKSKGLYMKKSAPTSSATE